MNPVLIVMKKEIKELFRDKRIRTNSVFMPALIMFVMLSIFGMLIGVSDKSNQIVHVVKTSNRLVDQLRSDKVKIVEVDSLDKGEDLIRQGKARVVLNFEKDFDAKLAQDKPTKIEAYFDPQQSTGKMALVAVIDDLNKINGPIGDAVLKSHQVKRESLSPATLEEKEVQVGTSAVSELLIGLMPYLIVVYAFYGAFGAGSDTVAGEKEKQTLETLLIAPVGRSQIAFGKFLSLAAISLCSSLSALMGIIIAGASKLPMYSKIFPAGLGLNWLQIGTILLVLVPTVAFFASLLLAVSAYAKNSRESQSYLGLISLFVLMPAIFGQVIGFTDLASNWWIRLVPVLNTSISIREALQGKNNALGLLLTVGVGALLALIGIRVAVFLFKREEVLTRV